MGCCCSILEKMWNDKVFERIFRESVFKGYRK